MDHQPQPRTKAETLTERRRLVALYERMAAVQRRAAGQDQREPEPTPGISTAEYECPEHYGCNGSCDPEALF